MDAAAWGLASAVFFASIVEAVEALTIVMAMGTTPELALDTVGCRGSYVALAAFTAAAGYALATWLPEAALQLVIGSLLLIFGLQWLRKAVLRSSGRKAMHDEEQIYADEVEQARKAGAVRSEGLDWFSFVVSFKGVFLEGVEVVFIVITFGLSANNMPVAITAAILGCGLVTAVGVALRHPLSKVPENTLKYGVGLLLTAFGTFWAVEGLGILHDGRESLAWPGSDLAIIVLVVAWFVLTRVLIIALRRPETLDESPAHTDPAVH